MNKEEKTKTVLSEAKTPVTSVDEGVTRKTLGTMEGPIVAYDKETRNGRYYSAELWDRVWSNPDVLESFENGGLFGELDHPEDRTEICSDRIAVLMKEPPVKKSDGYYWGKFTVLDTPCGRIIKAASDAGYHWGASSRGTGDYDKDTGEVDPDTYHFTCIDIVDTPSIETARMSLVESLQSTTKTKANTYKNYCNYRQNLTEALHNTKDKDERKLMRSIGKTVSDNILENMDFPKEWKTFIKEHPEVTEKFNWAKYNKYFDEKGALINAEGFEILKESLINKHANHSIKENLDEPKEWKAFKKLHPNGFNTKFNWKKYGKYFDDEGNCIDIEGFDKAMAELLKVAQLNKESKELRKGKDMENIILESSEEESVIYKIVSSAGVGDKSEEVIETFTTLNDAQAYLKEHPNCFISYIETDYVVVGKDNEYLTDAEEIYDREEAIKLAEDEDAELVIKRTVKYVIDSANSAESFTPLSEIIIWRDHYEYPDINTLDEDINTLDDEISVDSQPAEDACQIAFDDKLKDLIAEFVVGLEIGDTEEAIDILSDEEEDRFVTLFHEEFPDLVIPCESSEINTEDVPDTEEPVDSVEGDEDIVEQLQKALSQRDEYRKKLKEVQEEKAASNARVTKLKEHLSQFNSISKNAGQAALEAEKRFTEDKDSLNKEIESLKEALETSKREKDALQEEFNKTSKIALQYKDLAHDCANQYIESKAISLGTSSKEITKRLNENFTLNDVDQVCEDLKQISSNMNKLPFNVGGSFRAELTEDRSRDPLSAISSRRDSSVNTLTQELADSWLEKH